MRSGEAGSPEKQNMSPDKQPETHEGDPNGKREGGSRLRGPVCFGSMQ